MRLLLGELRASRIGGFFGLDVLLSAVALFVFVRRESARRRVPRAWLTVLARGLVGVSCGLPLFLYLRERSTAAPV